MKIHVIIITKLILLNFISAFYDGFIRRRYGLSNDIFINVTTLSNVNISDVCESQNKTCLWKCCPPGQHLMAHNKCKLSNISLSNITVYDAHFQNTSKSIETVFELVSGIMSDKTFKKNSFQYSSLYKPYLLENGNLFFEMPNSFNRWIETEINHFCVDMRVTKKIIRPVFMAEIKNDIIETYGNYGYALGVTVCFLLLTILTYGLFPQLRDINGGILIVFLIFFSSHMVIIINTIFVGTAEVHGYLVTSISYYFCLISSICWTNVMFYRILASNNIRDWTKKEVIIYCLYALGLPLLLATLVIVIEITDMTHMPWFVTPNIVDMGLCFFDGLESLYYLYIPFGLLLLFNWIACIINIVKFFKRSKSLQIVKIENNRRRLKSPLARSAQYVKLLVLLTFYYIVNILKIIYPLYEKGSEVCLILTLFMGPIIFITFVIDKNVLVMAKFFFAKFKTSFSSSGSVQFRNGCSSRN